MTRSLAWDALQVAQSDPIEDGDLAAAQLRRTAKACVQAWAACYRGVLHSLSGGLDSAIVLGCLRDTHNRPAITCLNYHSCGPEADERYFARLAANPADYPLLEWERDSAMRLLDRSTLEAAFAGEDKELACELFRHLSTEAWLRSWKSPAY